MIALDPEHNEDHQRAARDIDNSGRRFIRLAIEEAMPYFEKHQDDLKIVNLEDMRAKMMRVPTGHWVWVFPPGQQCFKIHQDREVQFLHRDQVSARTRLHEPLGFNEHENEELYKVYRARERG